MKPSPTLPFADRRHAGAELAARLDHYRGRDVVVLALPRGGVPVAYEVAQRLGGDLDVFTVRKIGMPGHREYGIGAIASGGVQVLDRDLLRLYGVPESAVQQVIAEEQAELARREREYRLHGPLVPLQNRIVILVDDGLATGSTMKAAAQAVRQHGPSRVVVAAPVGAQDSCRALADYADEVVCAETREPFNAVGLWYRDFSQTSDDEVHDLLARSRNQEHAHER